MKKALLLIFGIMLSCLAISQERYLQEAFSVKPAVLDTFGENFSIITIPVLGFPRKESLEMDVYLPEGDTVKNRPVMIYIHTGNFLPPITNGQHSGDKADSTAAEICRRWAKLGYVAASIYHRLGWNPVSPDQETRINTLINAAYRGVQDARTCVRYFKKTVAEDGNPYGIDPEKIGLFGQGTGGYISLATATLDSYNEIFFNLGCVAAGGSLADCTNSKFFGSDVNGDGTPDPMIITSINGDIEGKTLGLHPLTMDTLNLPNHVEYSSDFQFAVNMGGALGDSSWVDPSDPPIVSIQDPRDPNAPFFERVLTVPGVTPLPVVEVQGAHIIQELSNQYGNNDVFANAPLDVDPWFQTMTDVANARNDGLDGLFPIFGVDSSDSAPWEWWDAAFFSTIPAPAPLCPAGVFPPNCLSMHQWALFTNPTMSKEKATTYIDSIMGYIIPRAYAAFGLGGTASKVITLGDLDVGLILGPNPALDQVNIRTNLNNPIKHIEVFDLTGKLMRFQQNVDVSNFTLQRKTLSSGIYVAKLHFEKGIISKKIVFN